VNDRHADRNAVLYLCKCWFGSPTCRWLAQDAPKVLVLQLKRFEYSVYSRHKVTKKIDYQTSLDLAPFMSKPGAGGLVRPCLLVLAAHECILLSFRAYAAVCDDIWDSCAVDVLILVVAIPCVRTS